MPTQAEVIEHHRKILFMERAETYLERIAVALEAIAANVKEES